MKLKININFFLILIICTFFSLLKAQIPYTQGFNVSLTASAWISANLTVPWGNGSLFGITNIWQVNDNESGLPANTCGAAGMGNFSLHMGSTLGGGAAYLSNANTNRRISSPNINTTGFSGMTLSFNFIGNGSGTADKAYLQYSVNGGVTWISAAGAPTSVNPALPAGSNLNNLKSQLCVPQGLWTNLTWNLPATCDNIVNLRIAFVWQNNNGTAGPTDPSFAVDDLSITVPVVLPIENSELIASSFTEDIAINWKTFSEKNNLGFEIERSIDGINFYKIGFVKGKLNSTNLNSYVFYDKEVDQKTAYYYRFKQLDVSGNYRYSNIALGKLKETTIIKLYPNPANTELFFAFSSPVNTNLKIQLIDMYGRIAMENDLAPETNEFILNVVNIPAGIYTYKFVGDLQNTFGKIIITH